MAAMNINKEKYQELLKADKPLLVDFWAPWCSYCRRIGPAYDRIAQQFENDVNVVKINIDEEDSEAAAIKYGITSIPNIIAFKGGKPVANNLGFVPGAMLEAFVEKNL